MSDYYFIIIIIIIIAFLVSYVNEYRWQKREISERRWMNCTKEVMMISGWREDRPTDGTPSEEDNLAGNSVWVDVLTS